MGTLSRLPFAIYDHYVYVVGDPKINRHAKWIEENFSRIAKSLATGTAIVMGTDARVSGEIRMICF